MGLGFDTATQVHCWCWPRDGGVHAALVRHPGAAGAVRSRMSLFDALDGSSCRGIRLGVLKPVRKVYYNLTVTVLSVIVALVIGVIVLAGLVADRLGIESVHWL